MPTRTRSYGRSTRPLRRALLAILAVILASGLVAAPAAASPPDRSRAVDPIANEARYEQLATDWWLWVLGTTTDDGGPFDAGAVQCAVNQPDPDVLFLAAPFNISSTVERVCTDPLAVGTQIFFPVITVECSDQEDAPFFGASADDRRQCVEDKLFNPSKLRVKVDGRSLAVSGRKYEFVPPDFSFDSVEGNPTGLQETSGNSTARGNWVLLEPLSSGFHRIEFTGRYQKVDFSISVTYDLYVQ
jgi:hypothetical protein